MRTLMTFFILLFQSVRPSASNFFPIRPFVRKTFAHPCCKSNRTKGKIVEAFDSGPIVIWVKPVTQNLYSQLLCLTFSSKGTVLRQVGKSIVLLGKALSVFKGSEGQATGSSQRIEIQA